MKKLLMVFVVASVAIFGTPAVSGQELVQDTSQCPNERLELEGITAYPTGMWAGPVSFPCRATLDGATSITADATTYFGLTDGENFVGDVHMEVVDTATGETLAECSESGETPIDGFVPGLSSIARCDVAVDLEEPQDLTVACNASGMVAGTFRCELH